MTTAVTSAAGNVSRGITLIVATVFLFVCMDATAKYLAQSYPVAQVVWARYAFHCVFMMPFFVRWGLPQLVRTERLGLQLGRSFLLLACTFLFFTALRYIPLADAGAINFVSPLLVTALSVPLLGEKVGPRRWAAVLIGFAGVLIIIRPGAGVTHPAALLPLLVAFCFALFAITTRLLSRTDSTFTTFFYTATVGMVVMTAVVPFVWKTPDLAAWGLFAVVGLLGAVSHLLLIMAYKNAPAAVLAPFSYVQLIWAVPVGYVWFGDFPDEWTFVGAVIVVGSGLYVWYRERRLGKQ